MRNAAGDWILELPEGTEEVARYRIDEDHQDGYYLFKGDTYGWVWFDEIEGMDEVHDQFPDLKQCVRSVLTDWKSTVNGNWDFDLERLKADAA